jgi:hypothetical protein
MTTPTLKFGDRARLEFDIVGHPTECLEQTILGDNPGSIGAGRLPLVRLLSKNKKNKYPCQLLLPISSEKAFL